MKSAATTRISSKGQVVIPAEVRNRLGLEPGDRFVVVGDGDVVILRMIRSPSVKEFRSLIRTARRHAKEAGMKLSDIPKAVARARSRK